jgi:hypothetical protein
MNEETLKLAMRKAFNLGATYWQQADSEYSSEWKKADETKARLDQLVEETITAIKQALAAPVQPVQEPVLEVVNGQINRSWDAIPAGFTGMLYMQGQPNVPAKKPQPWGTYMGHRMTPAGTKEFWGWADAPIPVGTKLYTTPPAAPVQEPNELKHIGEQDSLLDVDESAWHLLVENRGGCRCHISPPCGACSNPISEEEMNEVGYTYTTPPAAQPAVPLTPEQRRNLWVSATIEPPSHENCYYRGIADSETYHGITEIGQP